MSERTATGVASRVTVAFSPADEATADALDAESYGAYLRRSRAGPVAVGDEFEEFVSTGCGTTSEVTLRVASVTGGDRIGEGTAFVFDPDESG